MAGSYSSPIRNESSRAIFVCGSICIFSNSRYRYKNNDKIRNDPPLRVNDVQEVTVATVAP